MPKLKQLHVRISDRDHALLTALAEERDENVATTVRRLIRQLRRGAVVAPASQPASQPLKHPTSLSPRTPSDRD